MRYAFASIIDPRVKRLQLSGLEVLSAAAGGPVSVVFTATDITAAWEGELTDASDTISGLVVIAGTVALVLNSVVISTGPFGELHAGDYAAFGLRSQGDLPASAAGQTVGVAVGSSSDLAAFGVGSPYSPGSNVLFATVTIAAAGSGSPGGSGGGGSGSGGGGGGGSGGGGSGGGGGTGPVSPVSTGFAAFWATLAPWEKVALVGAGALGVGGLVWLGVTPAGGRGA